MLTVKIVMQMTASTKFHTEHGGSVKERKPEAGESLSSSMSNMFPTLLANEGMDIKI